MRAVLWGVVLLALAVVALGLLAPRSRPQALAPGGLEITDGPILGRPGPHQMGVWVRTSHPTSFRVRYGLALDRLDHVSDAVVTSAEHDNTGWVLLQGLRADQRYHYQVVTAEAPNAVLTTGTFRTWPEEAGYRHPVHNPRGLFNVRFEVGSCSNQSQYSAGYDLPAYVQMVRRLSDNVHFAVMNGDFIYEEGRETTPAQWLAAQGGGRLPRSLELTPGLAGVWQNYKIYLRRGKPMAAWHRAVPSFFTYDDHEILNDVTGTGQVGHRDRRAVFRDVAVQGWYDYVAWSNPVEGNQGIHFGWARLEKDSDILQDTDADFTRLDLEQATNLHVHWGTPDAGVNADHLDREPGDPNAGVYAIEKVIDRHHLRIRPAAKQNGTQTYSIGRRSYYRWKVANCEFFALDTRGQREKHDGQKPDKAGVSMLGREQRDWLLQGMSKSDADFLFVVSSVPFAVPHVGSGGMSAAAADKDDAWTAFLDERDQLVKHWDGLNKPVIVLTGDLHNSFVVKVGERVWEACCGPHNSLNHPVGAAGDVPPNGPFTWNGRTVDILWSTFTFNDTPFERRRSPVYTVVQVNNVRNVPDGEGKARWVAYPRPQVVFQFHDGWTGDLLYGVSFRAGKQQ